MRLICRQQLFHSLRAQSVHLRSNADLKGPECQTGNMSMDISSWQTKNSLKTKKSCHKTSDFRQYKFSVALKSTFNLMETKIKGTWTKQQFKFQNYTQFLKSFHSWLQRSRVFSYNQKVCFYIFQKNKFSKGLSSNSGANINRFYGS